MKTAFFEDEENDKSSISSNEKRQQMSCKGIKLSELKHNQAAKETHIETACKSQISDKGNVKNDFVSRKVKDPKYAACMSPDSKYAALVEKYGRNGGASVGVNTLSAERISESKFNSVRSVFEQKARTNPPTPKSVNKYT